MTCIQPFNIFAGIHAFASDDYLTEEFLRTKANLLQVTVSNRVFLVDLKQESAPAIKELEASDQLMDVSKFVTPGHALTCVIEKKPMRIPKMIGVKQEILTNPSGHYYSFSQT